MKRILFVCNSISIGGAERVASILANAFIERGSDVYLLGFIRTSDTYKMDPRIKIIIEENENSFLKSKVQKIKSIRKTIKKYKIDTLIAFSHYNTMYAIIANTCLKCKLIGSERNDPAQLNSKKITNFIRMILYKKLDYLVCQTNDAKEYFPKSIQKNTVVILNPIIDGLPIPYEGEREKRVVCFCRLEPQKNIPMLINSFEYFYKSHPEYCLDIYGEGSKRGELIELINEKRLEESIHILPFTTNIHKEIYKAAMFALASDYEGFSNSMIEAMACGIPTIVTDCPCGGARMIIDNYYNGIMVPVGSYKEMAEAMSKVADNKELASFLGKNGIAIRKTLDKRIITDKWAKIVY